MASTAEEALLTPTAQADKTLTEKGDDLPDADSDVEARDDDDNDDSDDMIKRLEDEDQRLKDREGKVLEELEGIRRVICEAEQRLKDMKSRFNTMVC